MNIEKNINDKIYNISTKQILSNRITDEITLSLSEHIYETITTHVRCSAVINKFMFIEIINYNKVMLL